MYLKIAVISFFLIFFTMLLIMWINSIPTSPNRKSLKDPPIERIKVQPSVSSTENIQPSSSLNQDVKGISTIEGQLKTCINKCGDNLCQLVACQGSGCPCPENEAICPQDCR